MSTKIKLNKGFTLIELLIALAIVGLISAFAYPAYQKQAMKTKRSDAMVMLSQAASNQERLLAKAGAYSTNVTDVNPFGAESENGFYSITTVINNEAAENVTVNGKSISASCSGARCFVLVASAKGGQTADTDCTFFVLDNIGRKRSYNSSAALNATGTCWK